MPTVTLFIGRLKAGSRSALAVLGNRFHTFRLRQAERRLGPAYPGLLQPDDVSNLVLLRLWQEVEAGRRVARGLCDTASLLSALSLLTSQQVQKARCYDRRGKRAVARTVALDVDPVAPGPVPLELPAGLTGRQRKVAELLADGWRREDLPDELGCSLSSVYRDVMVIQNVLRSAGA